MDPFKKITISLQFMQAVGLFFLSGKVDKIRYTLAAFLCCLSNAETESGEIFYRMCRIKRGCSAECPEAKKNLSQIGEVLRSILDYFLLRISGTLSRYILWKSGWNISPSPTIFRSFSLDFCWAAVMALIVIPWI